MAAKPSKKQLQQKVTQALAMVDAAGVFSALEAGLPPAWQDDAGRGLLHYAAAWGDEAFAEQLMAKGVPARLRDAHLETAADLAAAYGHDGLSQKFAAAAAREQAAAPVQPLPYKTLQDIRDETAKNAATVGGVDAFYRLAREGRFADVAALAEREGGGFTARDLLGRGPNGDTTAEVLAATGQFKAVMKTALWLKNARDFQAVWQSLPAAYQKGLEAGHFMTDLRQARLESYVKPKLRGLDKGFKGPQK